VNPRTRRLALYAIGTIAILASANALAHSYAGLYDWAIHHQLTGWQAKSWPAEIDVFLAVGELALYVAYLDGWPARQRIWPWATALTGLAVSVAGNIGHIQGAPGHPVILADRLTAATSPLAAFAGLSVGLLVLKMTRHRASTAPRHHDAPAALMLAAPSVITDAVPRPAGASTAFMRLHAQDGMSGGRTPRGPDPRLLRDASAIVQNASVRGQRLSQRSLARQLRRNGHHFPNDHLRLIAETIGLGHGSQAA
jgi:hypothetical protein